VSPRTSHRQAVKRILRYLRHTSEFGLWYSASSSLALHGFSNADFAGCRLDRKSTSGTCQFLGYSLVSWSSHKQSSVAQSTIEAEYVAIASCCSQLLWITYTMSVAWTSLGPLHRWVPGPTTRWAPGTTRLALHGI
jgi:histone deacetylase 1/2